MAKKTSKTSKKTSTANPASTHKFVPKKAFKAMKRTFGDYREAGGVRALVVKSLPKSGATAVQVAKAVSKHRDGYTADSALNCLRWLQSKGHVQRLH
jgi:hypothetical protein